MNNFSWLGIRNIFVLLILVCLSTLPAAGSLQESIDALLADPVLVHGIQGVVVESLNDGRVIYARNRDLVFIPASNLKLLVSAAALDRLGPDFCCRTVLYHTGSINNGILYGDLILKGGGDPLLKIEDLDSMIKSLEELGVEKVTGRILGDDTRFDDVRLGEGWSWDDEPFYYSAQISALNLNRNVVDVHVKPATSVGEAPIICIEPSADYLIVNNEAVTGSEGSANTLLVDRLRGRNVLHVTGSIPLDHKSDKREEAIAVEDPAAFAASVFRDRLLKSGISVAGNYAKGVLPGDAQIVTAHTSPPLKKIIAELNKSSDNLIAEVLLKTLGAELDGEGSTAAGRKVEVSFLDSLGVDLGAAAIVDGSGLSRLNYMTPGNFIKLLRYMYIHKHSEVFTSSLPIAGVDGSLRSRMIGTAAENNVRAKTGYLSRVSTLSGYVTSKSGEPLVFSILMNNHLCRNSDAIAIQNKICALLAEIE